MSIDSLNQTGALPPPPAVMPVVREEKASAPRAGTGPAPVQATQAGTADRPESKEQIEQTVQQIQEAVDNLAQNLRFSVDEETGKTIIKVMDSHTEEIIRQIPTEEAVEIARALDKAQGLLFNGKA